jgi:hypothetical protein
MSSRLNPRDYDLGELRDAVGETPRGDDDATGDGRDDGQSEDLSAIRDLLHGDAGDGTAAGRSSDARPPADGLADGRSTGERATESRSAGHTSSGRVPGDVAGETDGTDGTDGTNGEDGADDTDDLAGEEAGGGTDHSSVGRMRRQPARSVQSGRRDLTRDGEPGRLPGRGDAQRSGRGSSTGTERPDAGRTTSRGRGAGVGDLGLLAAGAGDHGRPYLDKLPDAYPAQLEIFEWLEWLLGTCGREATASALAYYEEVGWLSEGVREGLEGFLEGLAAAKPQDPRPLGVDDHRESLRYVARLAHRGDR